MDPLIKIKNLSVTYFKGQANEVRAVRNVSLEISKGEFVIFFGPSGCGKSTLLYSITGLEKHVEGDIFVGGKRLSDMSNKEFNNYCQTKIGMVFQAYYLIPSITVMQNIMLPQMAINVPKSKRQESGLKMLKFFNIAEQADKFPQELSGGQQQRAAICRALINNPEIIFADEPVGNLDSKSADSFYNLLVDLNAKSGKTVVLVTHDPSYLHLADRVFFIKDGEHVDTRVNKFKSAAAETKEAVEAYLDTVSKDFKMLEKSFSFMLKIKDQKEFDDYRAKNIISEMFNELSLDEVGSIENRIKKLLISHGQEDYKEIFSYLDKSNNQGGLDMDIRTAKNLVRKIYRAVELMEILRKEEDLGYKTEVVKDYLFSEFELRLEENQRLDVFYKAIRSRLESQIDMSEFKKMLDQPVESGGVGLDARTAHKVAKRMELLMLGKYQLTFKPINEIQPRVLPELMRDSDKVLRDKSPDSL